jgi:hypothetical protein
MPSAQWIRAPQRSPFCFESRVPAARASFSAKTP